MRKCLKKHAKGEEVVGKVRVQSRNKTNKQTSIPQNIYNFTPEHIEGFKNAWVLQPVVTFSLNLLKHKNFRAQTLFSLLSEFLTTFITKLIN